MSSYVKKLVHPVTGKEQVALCIDDYYSPHEYGYGFRKDGGDAHWDDTKFEDCEFFKVEALTKQQ